MTDEPIVLSGARRAVHRVLLHRRDSIGSAYQVLTFESERAISVGPGQFAMVRSETWGAAPLLPRPMSLLTGGHRPSILIKVVGEGTRRMAVASSGEPFSLLAPLGKEWSPVPSGARAVFVAGGVGVAPLLFFARTIAQENGAPPIALYGGRTHADLPFERELSSVSDLRIATEDGSRGARGRVTALLGPALDELAEQGAGVKVYTCGPHAMMAAVAAICAERGVRCEVSLETPMGCGYGVCLGCPVPRATGGYLYACTEGPCVDASAIDWGQGHAAKAQGGAR